MRSRPRCPHRHLGGNADDAVLRHSQRPAPARRPAGADAVSPDPQLLLGQRFGLAYVLRLTNEAIQAAMLGTVGFVVLGMWLRRRWAAMLVAIVLFTPVASTACSPPARRSWICSSAR